MRGWAYENNGWVETDDVSKVEATITRIVDRLTKESEALSDASSTKDIDAVANVIQGLAPYYNTNIEFLERAARRDRIREIKAAVRQLNEPPDQPPAA